MRYRLLLAPGERDRIAARFQPNAEKMHRIGAVVRQQIDQRFESQGASGGVPWPKPKFVAAIGRPDGRKLLEGRTGNLRSGWQQSDSTDSTQVASDNVAAAMAQSGTVGKGGDLPDIVPRRAKMLFIPISDRAASSTPVTAFGIRRRMAQDGEPLVRGRIKGGQLVPPNADFLLLHKVSIPPRPMLPASNAEVEKQTDAVVEILKS
jgi:hypothetical protein